ncbi:MAG: MATE family efflux transporter, partial [Thermoprotei archaeon]
NISYNLADTFWLGKLGKADLAAPTVSWPLIMLFYSIGMGFSFAGATLISQYIGAGEREYANRCVGYLLGFMLLMSLSISTIGFIVSPLVLELMGVPLDVLPKAINYIRVIFAGIPLAFIGFAFMAILNSIGDTRTPTILSIISSLINVVLDPLLIFGWLGFPALGVMGAAIATIASRSIISVIGLYLLAKGFAGIKIGFRDLFFRLWWLRHVVRIGTPLSIQRSANSLGFVIMMSLVSQMGTAVIATYGIGIRVIDVIQAFTWGIMRASSIMIGQNIGAEKYQRAGQIAFKNMALVSMLLGVGALLIYLSRSFIFAVFINDPVVIEEGDKFVTFFIPSLPFFGLFFIAGAVAQGSGHPTVYTIISIIRLWVLRIGFSYLLGIFMGMGSIGIWIAMSISNMGAGIMATTWVMKGSWKQRVIEIPRAKRISAMNDSN